MRLFESKLLQLDVIILGRFIFGIILMMPVFVQRELSASAAGGSQLQKGVFTPRQLAYQGTQNSRW